MELREFVSATISDICNGIVDAQNKVKDIGACIAPGMAKDSIVRDPNNAYTPQFLDFDIAVTITENSNNSSGHNAGANISVLGICLSINGKNIDTKELSAIHVSRIKFSVPVLYPVAPAENRQSDVPQDQTKYSEGDPFSNE